MLSGSYKLIWKNKAKAGRLIAVKFIVVEGTSSFVEAWPCMPDSGYPWVSEEQEKELLASSDFSKKVTESLIKVFKIQKKNPDWVEEYLEAEEVKSAKNTNRVDPRLRDAYYSKVEEEANLIPPKPQGKDKPTFDLEKINDLTQKQLMALCMEHQLPWEPRSTKQELIETIKESVGFEETEEED